jgi:radical SAM superfamily enzyme YgiQ (UPF0313 family)
MPESWVALVGPEIEENLSLRYLASSLSASGIRSEIFAFNEGSHLGAVLKGITEAPTPPVLVGISLAFQWRALDFLGLAMALRESGYSGHITVGGHFATFASADLLRDFPELDSVCRQESEETIVDLVKALASGSQWTALPGLCVRDASGDIVLNPARDMPDLTRLPWPDRRGEPAAVFGHKVAPLVSTRGCYANCSFCCIAAWHEEANPGKRYRSRPLADVADEMMFLHRERGVEIFVFQDDNFFLPGPKRNAERFNALADALEERGIGHFATIVKARPTDVHPEVFRILRDRLKCLRAYVGIETDSDQGLVTLKRMAGPRHNRIALDTVRQLNLYVTFNLLIFDPDTTLADFETNVAFMEENADFPFNFCRTELYAGTPLLARMQQEGRCRGDYLQWDYSLRSPDIERVFQMAATAFHERNFATGALANALMGTRFDVEACRHFHPREYDPAWLEEAKLLSRTLGHDSVRALRAIVAHVRAGQDPESDPELADRLGVTLRETEREVRERARDLARNVYEAVGQGLPLTDLTDRVATPLQRAVAEVAA